MKGAFRFLIRVMTAVSFFTGILICAPPARAQAPDSSEKLLMQRPAATPDAALSRLPGVFTWSFRAAGWPDGPAPFGADPGAVRLIVDGHDWDDLVTGRPRYDLAPAVLMGDVHLDGPYTALFRTERLAVAAPLTRLRYTSTGDGLQEARVAHVQDRSVPGAAPPDSGGAAPRLNVLFGYEGAGSTNEYPGSRLRRARRVIGRIAVRAEHWEISLLNVANRRRIGAHGGVESVPGRGYESIYQRLGAVVTDEEHGRRTIRNDLILRATARGRMRTGMVDLFWTSQTHSFDDGPSLERWEVHRFGGRLRATNSVGSSVRVGVDASAAVETPGGFIDSLVTIGIGYDERILGGAGAELEALVYGARARLRAGAGVDDDRVYPDMSFSITHSRFDASAAWSGRTNAWIDYTGFFGRSPEFVTPPDARTFFAVASTRGRIGRLSVEPRAAFIRETDAPVRMLGDDATNSTAGSLSGPASRATLSVSIGLNAASDHGAYAVLSPSIHTAGLDARTEFDRAWKDASPDAWIDGRVGYRRLMFKGDLDLDAYVRGRAWSDMRGRRLHTPTGLLMLAPDGSGTVGSSGLLDLVAEAGVRGAVIILAWENALSGTSVQAGNLLVPDYPLPAQRLRFGVYWPISN